MYDSKLKKINLALKLALMLFLHSCEEPSYELDNPADPGNMNLNPPALFFHPSEIHAGLGETIEVDIYGLELEPSSAAKIEIIYDHECLSVDYIEPGPFFIGLNNPIEIIEESQDGVLNIFIFYLPDMNSNVSVSGTWSIATVHFNTTMYVENSRTIWLEYGSGTDFRDQLNNQLIINDLESTCRINIE